MKETKFSTYIYASPIGTLEINGSENGIRSIIYIETTETSDSIPDCLTDCVMQLEEYFNGNRTSFSLKLDPSGSEFQLRVWQQLVTIPFGDTISYLQLAVKTGDAKAVRAVGHANGQNRLNIIIPCHRVIGANGKLTGYGGGLWRKEWLLKHEIKDSMPGLFRTES